MDYKYLTGIVVVLAQVLPFLGIKVGSEELTITIKTLIAVAGGLYVAVSQYRSGKIGVFGGVKKHD